MHVALAKQTGNKCKELTILIFLHKKTKSFIFLLHVFEIIPQGKWKRTEISSYPFVLQILSEVKKKFRFSVQWSIFLSFTLNLCVMKLQHVLKVVHPKYSKIWPYFLTYTMNFDCSKGQLISKSLFGIFNSPKKRTKKFGFKNMVPQVKLFSFVFWENWKHTKIHFKIM